MQNRTQTTLEQLQQADWFHHVGEPREGPFVVVSSWNEAITRCSSPEWEDLTLEAANRFSEAVARRSHERFQQWNAIVAEMRQAIVPILEQKIKPARLLFHLPQVFEDVVRWDVLHLCMEAEYADIFPPGFFASQGYWYVQGRFPCGWDGDFPSGKLFLY